MSRIFVKNLPKHASEDRLREFFSQKGEVTDAKIMRTNDGKTRQFGFVGFRTECEAQEAIKYFHKSFMDTHRITCEIAYKVGDPDIPRPWSRHSLKKKENSSVEGKKAASSKVSKAVKQEGKSQKSVKDDKNDDTQFQEFIELMQPHSKSKMWANDTVAAVTRDQSNAVPENKYQMAKEESKLVGDLKGTGEVNAQSEKANEPKILVHDEEVSDMDYFRSRIKKKWSDSESSDNESDGDNDDNGGEGQDKNNNDPAGNTLEPEFSEGDDGPSKEPEFSEGDDGQERGNGLDEPSSSHENEVLESSRLFVRNLPYTATEEELENHFSKYGTVSRVHIVIDKETRRSKGFGYVQFALPESAYRALEEMDSSPFQGRLLHVMPAKKQPSYSQKSKNDEGPSSKSLKHQKNAERKALEEAGNTRAWNSLYMRPDTVVENVARKFGLSKSEFLDRESDDLAVRVALGETQVIAETKKALSKAGVNVSSLEEFAAGKDGGKRSNHVILVKNLPYGSSESELSSLFGESGSLDKIILPPTKTLALVVFLEPAEARKAFDKLRYKRYKDGPLYLEWAPGNILSQTSAVDDKGVDELDVNRAVLKQQIEDPTEADADPDRIESRSLYVKNLNFRTSDESVKRHFAEHMKGGKILSVRVKTLVKNGKTLSMGFGFIEFDSVDTAVKVCKDLQGTVLDGHALILQLCHHKKDETIPKKIEDGMSAMKLIVRNIAFEATEKDLRQLFSPFGQIKRLRLPMKFGRHRGFAFVEFVTKQEARNALEALSNTHLYGRHLVLERAKEGESIDELRARTAAQFTGSDKLSKKRKHASVLDEGNAKFKRIVE